MDRRIFLRSVAALGGSGVAHGLMPAWAHSHASLESAGLPALTGNEFVLSAGAHPVTIDGRTTPAITVNGQLPAPVLRWREGEDITIRVTNDLDVDTSIHWHGILLPFQMDGVPGITFPGIAPAETFTYRFPVRQSGTYWYHSHSGLQEQMGHYGPIIIDPAGPDPVAYDREYVIMLGDWTFDGPHVLFDRLKKVSDAYNFQQRTLNDFLADARRDGFGETLADRAMWGRMRMSMTDISDVTAAGYTYLINGHGPDDNWTGLFRPGERVRLRIINASAMTIFNLRIPGLAMNVVQADGLHVQPVQTDEMQIGVAETYDVVVEPGDRAYTIMAESIDRSGFVRGTLAPRPGMQAEVPPLRERPLLTMRDMGMDHAGGVHSAHSMAPVDDVAPTLDHAAMGHEMPVPAPIVDHAAMGHGDRPPLPVSSGPQRHDHPVGPGVANTPANPANRLNERGIGLADEPHHVLVYTDLRSLERNPDQRPPGREVEVHLTSNMERYMWSFDGVGFSEVVEPIVFEHNERLRLTLVNDTMMPHPIHLHGMFFDVVTGDDTHKPRKHTIVVKPAEKLSVDITADALGEWAFHCHLMYHMHAGMFQVVSVRPGQSNDQSSGHAHHGMGRMK
jgi:CopA family copper-resistance protein